LKEGSKEYDHEVAIILEKNKNRDERITYKRFLNPFNPNLYFCVDYAA
jgi:hypothetical protein